MNLQKMKQPRKPKQRARNKKNNTSAGSAADEDPDTEDDEQKPEQPKSNWFDEGFVSRAKRAQETQQSKCEDTVNRTLQTAAQQFVEATGSVHHNPMREIDTLKSRLRFLLHVAGYGEVEDWSAISADTFSNAPVTSEDLQVQGLKHAMQSCNEARPPCENYKQLEPLQVIKKFIERRVSRFAGQSSDQGRSCCFCEGNSVEKTANWEAVPGSQQSSQGFEIDFQQQEASSTASTRVNSRLTALKETTPFRFHVYNSKDWGQDFYAPVCCGTDSRHQDPHCTTDKPRQ